MRIEKFFLKETKKISIYQNKNTHSSKVGWVFFIGCAYPVLAILAILKNNIVIINFIWYIICRTQDMTYRTEQYTIFYYITVDFR